MIHYAEAVKAFFQYVNMNRVRVEGTSMWPSIQNNQLVDISYMVAALQPGTCYAFLYRNRLIVHRFVTYSNGKAVFMGDRSHSIEAIADDCIIGEVVLRQYPLITRMITIINLFYFHFLSSFQKGKSIRMICILFLTIGAKYAGKV